MFLFYTERIHLPHLRYNMMKAIADFASLLRKDNPIEAISTYILNVSFAITFDIFKEVKGRLLTRKVRYGRTF